MSSRNNIYSFDFNGNSFEVDEKNRSVLKNQIEFLEFTPQQFDILKLLIKKAQNLVTRSTFEAEVWKDTIVEGGGLTKQISVIQTKLGCKGIIENIPKTRNSPVDNGGYRFAVPVNNTKIEEQSEEVDIKFESDEFQSKINPKFLLDETKVESHKQKINFKPQNRNIIESAYSYFGLLLLLISGSVGVFLKNGSTDSLEKTIFVTIISILYGCLVGTGLVLESAYRFDEFGWNASLMALFIAIVNITAMLCALSIANSLLQSNMIAAFVAGFLFLIIGAIITCGLAYSVLPNFPITAANFQTQPAFTAFCKNVIVYFLPIYSVFGLLLFCFIYDSSKEFKNIAFPIGFFVIWLILVGFSYISTNYLSDNLLTEKDGLEYKYHGLFSALLLCRACLCFIPSFLAIILYFFKSLNYAS